MARLTEEQFTALVAQSEAAASRDIKAYKTRLALFAALGYLVIFGILTSLVLMVGGTIAMALFSSTFLILLLKKKFIFVLIAGIWTLLRALWVTFDPPQGRLLERHEFPALFAEIDQLTKALESLTIHRVLLDNQLNAAVIQSPRFGLLGGNTNTLILGLQLLMTLSPEQARAVLAHEFGHLSSNHSRFNGWIYRVRLSWNRIMVAFDESASFGAGLMRRFFDWYAPHFMAYSFALARNNEYEADKIAAELTSPDIAASALINTHIASKYLDTVFWDNFYRQADNLPSPPKPPFTSLERFLQLMPSWNDKAQALLADSLGQKTHYADTHPALQDRLQAFTHSTALPQPVQHSAAAAWLGDRYASIIAEFDEQWMTENSEAWQQRNAFIQQANQTLAHGKATDIDSLDDDQLWEVAVASKELEAPHAALGWFQAYHQRHPDSIGAAYYMGQLLAATDNLDAMPHLQRCLANPNTFRDAAQCGYQLLKKHGLQDEADQWWASVVAQQDHFAALQHERNTLSTKDTLTPPDIDAETLDALRKQLQESGCVKAAWLCQKTLKLDHPEPVYALAFKPSGFRLSADTVIKELQGKLSPSIELFITCLSGDDTSLAKKIKKQGIKIL